MSYTYYTVIGVLTVIVVGLIVSYFTGPNNPNHMDPDLFSPVIQRYLKTEHEVVAEIKLMKKRVNENHDSHKLNIAVKYQEKKMNLLLLVFAFAFAFIVIFLIFL